MVRTANITAKPKAMASAIVVRTDSLGMSECSEAERLRA
jgi:hypothetical protein